VKTLLSSAIAILFFTPPLLGQEAMQPNPLLGQPNIYLSLRSGYVFASLKDWAKQFNPEPPTTVMPIGLEIAYDLGSLFHIGGGYEYGFGKMVKIQNDPNVAEDEATYSFVYGTVKAGRMIEFAGDRFFLYGGADLGPITATETVKGTNGATIEAEGTTFALRPKTGGLLFFGERWSTTFELAYFIANVSDIKLFGQTLPSYSLNYSGLGILLGISYHLPIATN
jgi:hypothetical protein